MRLGKATAKAHEARGLLPDNLRDISAQVVIDVLNALPAHDEDDDDRVEYWMQRMFS